MNLRQITSGLAAVVALTSVATDRANAQGLPVSTLYQLGCIQIETGGYWRVAQNISVNRQIFTAVTYMGGISKPGVYFADRVEMVCGLPGVRGLNLSVAFADNAPYVDNRAQVRLVIYKDGQRSEEKIVRRGELANLAIDLTNTRSLAIGQECVTTSTDSNYCPNLYFMQETLVR